MGFVRCNTTVAGGVFKMEQKCWETVFFSPPPLDNVKASLILVDAPLEEYTDAPY